MGSDLTECTIKSWGGDEASCMRVLPQAPFQSRQMERHISTACSAAFIKQATKAVLTVSYF